MPTGRMCYLRGHRLSCCFLLFLLDAFEGLGWYIEFQTFIRRCYLRPGVDDPDFLPFSRERHGTFEGALTNFKCLGKISGGCCLLEVFRPSESFSSATCLRSSRAKVANRPSLLK